MCTLNTKLAIAESMTHDVIRDLLSVKLDISNYAVSVGLDIQDIAKKRFSLELMFWFLQTIIEQHQLQKLIEEAHQHRQDFVAMVYSITLW